MAFSMMMRSKCITSNMFRWIEIHKMPSRIQYHIAGIGKDPNNILSSAEKTNIKLIPKKIKLLPTNSGYNAEQINIAKNRPLSPHFFIYHWQLPGLMSGSHRVTGALISTYAVILGIGSMISPHEFSFYIDWIRNIELNWYLLATLKSLIAFPFVYHFTNGIRYLTWDMGKLLDIPKIYTTGYIALAIVFGVSGYLGFCM